MNHTESHNIETDTQRERVRECKTILKLLFTQRQTLCNIVVRMMMMFFFRLFVVYIQKIFVCCLLKMDDDRQRKKNVFDFGCFADGKHTTSKSSFMMIVVSMGPKNRIFRYLTDSDICFQTKPKNKCNVFFSSKLTLKDVLHPL